MRSGLTTVAVARRRVTAVRPPTPARLLLLACWVVAGAGAWSALGLVPAAAAPVLPGPPPVSAPVLDDAHVLSTGEITALDTQLGQDDRSATAQIAVATVPTTGGPPIATYAEDLFNDWGVGHSSSDDGVLILVAVDQRQVRIQTGSGLGARLPDATAQQIVDDDMLPAFRAGQDDRALSSGVEAVRVAVGLPPSSLGGTVPAAGAPAAGAAPAPATPAPSSGSTGTAIFWVVGGAVVLGTVGLIVKAGNRGRGRPPGGQPGHPGNPGGVYVGGGGMGGGGGFSGGGFGGGSSGGGGATGGW